MVANDSLALYTHWQLWYEWGIQLRTQTKMICLDLEALPQLEVTELMGDPGV